MNVCVVAVCAGITLTEIILRLKNCILNNEVEQSTQIYECVELSAVEPFC